MRLRVKFREERSIFKPRFGEIYKVGGYSGEDNTQTYILVTDDGQEIPAVLVEEETAFTATENDIRKGMTAATDDGITVGTKVIPSYHTTEGYVFIPSGHVFQTNSLPDLDKYDYTKLQVIICPYQGSIANSVAADRIAINDGVYAVNSTKLLATVTKDSESKKINLGIINESETLYLMRYFTYKEIH